MSNVCPALDSSQRLLLHLARPDGNHMSYRGVKPHPPHT